jgi:hypothetical protein
MDTDAPAATTTPSTDAAAAGGGGGDVTNPTDKPLEVAPGDKPVTSVASEAGDKAQDKGIGAAAAGGVAGAWGQGPGGGGVGGRGIASGVT